MADGPRNDRITDAEKALRNLRMVLDVLPILLARDTEQVGPDGYPAGGGEGPGSDISRPTENAAILRLAHKPQDLVHEWTQGILDELDKVTLHANTAAGLVQVINEHVDHRTGRQSSVKECSVCALTVLPPDRLRAGRCVACYQWMLNHPDQRDRPKDLWVK